MHPSAAPDPRTKTAGQSTEAASRTTSANVSYNDGNNNKCDINYHVISENGYSKSKVCVKANKNTFGNVITENLKGLKEGGNILIEPILEIDTNEVEASHFVTIGTYDEESLLYLNSLGIKENDAKKLLKKSFMLSIFDDNFKKEVNYE